MNKEVKNLLRGIVIVGLGVSLASGLETVYAPQPEVNAKATKVEEEGFSIYPLSEGIDLASLKHQEPAPLTGDEYSEYAYVSENYMYCGLADGSLICPNGLDFPDFYLGIKVAPTKIWKPTQEGIKIAVVGYDKAAMAGVQTWIAIDYDRNTFAISTISAPDESTGIEVVTFPLGRAALHSNI